MKNSFYLIPAEKTRFLPEEIASDGYGCRDVSFLSQVMPLIEEFTRPGELILEPFCGLGTTVIGAGMLGRRSLGIEIEPARFALLQRHVSRFLNQMTIAPELVCADSLSAEFPSPVDAVVTNVPYFSPDRSVRCADGSLYSVREYDAYLAMIEQVLVRCSRSLKTNGYLVLFSENVRLPNGNMLPQTFDICKLVQRHFLLKEERIVLYQKALPAEGAASGSHLTNRAHEYILIAKKKPDERDFDRRFEQLLPLARLLTAQGDAAVIGSFGTWLTDPQVLDHRPMDLDLLIRYDEQSIRRAVSLLQREGFAVSSWQDLLGEDFPFALLQGRYYLRAVRGGLTVDLTYEIEGEDFDALQPHYRTEQGVGVFDRAGQMRLLSVCDRADLQERLELLRQQAGRDRQKEGGACL